MTNQHKLDDPELKSADLSKQLELLKLQYAERNLGPSAAVFTTRLKIRWHFHNPGSAGTAGEYILDQTSGDLLDLGAKNWFYVGTASGTQYYKGQRPITLACSMEFTASTASIKWAVAYLTQVYGPLSENSEGIQYKADVNGSPKVIVVRKQIAFANHYIHPSSYTTFTEE